MANKKNIYLFAKSSFLEGVARLIDFSGTLDDCNSIALEQTDGKAIAADWKVVGGDFNLTIEDTKSLMRDSLVKEARKQLNR